MNAHKITLNSIFLATLNRTHKDLEKEQPSRLEIHSSTHCFPEETKKDPESKTLDEATALASVLNSNIKIGIYSLKVWFPYWKEA